MCIWGISHLGKRTALTSTDSKTQPEHAHPKSCTNNSSKVQGDGANIELGSNMDQAPHKLDLQHLPASQAPWPHPGVLLATGSLPRIPQNSLGIISFSHTQFLLPKLQLSPAKVQSHQLIIPAQLSSNLLVLVQLKFRVSIVN